MRFTILLFISFAFSVSGATIRKDIDGKGTIVNIIVNIDSIGTGNCTEMEDTANVNGENTLEPTTTIFEPTTSKPTTLEPTTLEPTTFKPTTLEPTTTIFEPTTFKPTTLEPTTTTLEPTTTTLEPTTTKLSCPDDKYLVGNACVAKFDSKIIETDQMQADLTALIDVDTKSLALCYRGTRDGFGAAVFHTKCDGKAKTLTIVKSTKGFVFGGYTSVAWDSVNSWKEDTSAYLFSLTNPLNKPAKMNIEADGTYAVYHNSHGPTFGNGYDLIIKDNSNSDKVSFTSPSKYVYPDEINAYKNGETWIHGDEDEYFQTLEVEVFQVV